MPCSCSTIARSPAVTCSPDATTAVIFAPVAKLGRLLAPADELIGLSGHGGDHHGNFMARPPLARDVPCNIANALYVCDRSAAEFHHKSGHPVENASPAGIDFRLRKSMAPARGAAAHTCKCPNMKSMGIQP